jgi:hypothetical protein
MGVVLKNTMPERGVLKYTKWQSCQGTDVKSNKQIVGCFKLKKRKQDLMLFFKYFT